MDIAEFAKKVDALEAELAAKSSRIADLEARVSLLETENARLRKVMPERDAMDHTGKNSPIFGRLEEGFGGNKQKPVDIAMEVGDGEGEGMTAPVVPTPVDFDVPVATGQSDDEVKIMDDANVGLDDDDDVSITPRGKKREAARVISDSESGEEDENDGERGNQEVGVASSRKRALRVSDSESEEDDDGEPYEMEGCCTPAPRRSGRLVKSQSKRIRPARQKLEFEEPKDHEQSEDGSEEHDSMDEFIDDSDCTEFEEPKDHEQSEDGSEEDESMDEFIDDSDCTEFEEPKDHEQSEDGSEEDDSMDDFIDDSDCTENPADPAEELSSELEESDNEENNGNIVEWDSEADILSAFGKQPDLCLKAVCALYRKQTDEEKAHKSTFVHNKKGFSQIDAPRGSYIAQFLLDGDASGPPKKTAQELEMYNPHGVEFCEKLAFHYSKQLLEIYQNKEDPYFP